MKGTVIIALEAFLVSKRERIQLLAGKSIIVLQDANRKKCVSGHT